MLRFKCCSAANGPESLLQKGLFAYDSDESIVLHQRGVVLGRLGVAGVVFCISHLGRFASWQGVGAWPRAGMAGEIVSVATWGGR